MINYELHTDCKLISGAEYKNSNMKVPASWKRLTGRRNIYTGFNASVYKRRDEIIIVFRGTDSPTDIINNDLNMLQKVIPQQMKDARKIYKDVRRAYPDCKIIFTGHSLGASEAQLMGAETGCETITFSAYGTKNLYGARAIYSENITNYGNSQDFVYISNIDNQIGKTIVLNSNINDFNYVIKSDKPLSSISLKPHKLENFGDLFQGVEYQKEVFENTDAPLFKTGIEYVDYDDSVFDTNNRILYSGEVNIEDMKEELSDLFLEQIFSMEKFPTKEELDKRTRLGELIYVHDYVRSDGTKVSGYYRTCPQN